MDGDHLTLLNAFHAWKQHNEDPNWSWDNFLNQRALKMADNIRNQLVRTCTRLGLRMVSNDFNSKDYYPSIRKAILTGFFSQVRGGVVGGGCTVVGGMWDGV